MKADLRYFRWMIVRHFPVLLLVISLGTAATFIVESRVSVPYEAKTRLIVDAPGAIRAQGRAASPRVELEVLQHRTMTRPSLMEMVKSETLAEDFGLPASEIVDRILHNTEVTITSGRDKATIMDLRVSDLNPNLASRMANALAARLLAENSAVRNERSAQSLDVLQAELDKRSSDLATHTRALREFRSDNASDLPSQLIFLRAERNELRETLSAASKRDDIPRSAADLELQLSAALLLYSERHPKVRRLKQQIASLSEESGTVTHSQDLAGLRTRISQLEARLEQMPRIGRDLADLEQQVKFAQSQYSVALDQFTAAKTKAQIEMLASTNRLVIIEPAIAPVGPPTNLSLYLIAAGMILSVMSAICAVYWLQRNDRKLRRPKDLTHALGLTPFAVLPDFSRQPA